MSISSMATLPRLRCIRRHDAVQSAAPAYRPCSHATPTDDEAQPLPETAASTTNSGTMAPSDGGGVSGQGVSEQYTRRGRFLLLQAGQSHERLQAGAILLHRRAKLLQWMRADRDFCPARATRLLRPCAARIRLRWVMLILTPKCSCSSA